MKSMGLEMTRVHREAQAREQIPRRQMESLRESLMDHAKRECDASGCWVLRRCRVGQRRTSCAPESSTLAEHRASEGSRYLSTGSAVMLRGERT